MAAPVSAEIKTISTTGTYTAGTSESIDTAKHKALQDAMRLATEQAGVLVSSYSKTNNMVLTEDEVTTVASKIVKVTREVYDVKLISDSNIQVTANIDAQIDTDSIQDDIRNLKQENQELTIKYNEAEDKNKALLAVQNRRAEIESYYHKYYTMGNVHVLTNSSTIEDCRQAFCEHMARREYGHAYDDYHQAKYIYAKQHGFSVYDLKYPQEMHEGFNTFNLWLIDSYIADGKYKSAYESCGRMISAYRAGKVKLYADDFNKFKDGYYLLKNYRNYYHPEWQDYGDA